MKPLTHPVAYVAYRPGSNDLRRFASYEEAWRFTEAEFAAGNGVWTVERLGGRA